MYVFISFLGNQKPWQTPTEETKTQIYPEYKQQKREVWLFSAIFFVTQRVAYEEKFICTNA